MVGHRGRSHRATWPAEPEKVSVGHSGLQSTRTLEGGAQIEAEPRRIFAVVLGILERERQRGRVERVGIHPVPGGRSAMNPVAGENNNNKLEMAIDAIDGSTTQHPRGMSASEGHPSAGSDRIMHA